MPEINQEKVPHYHGNTVRMLFMISAIIMLVNLPVYNERIGVPTTASVIAILILALAAGLTSPRQLWTAGFNTLVSAVGFLVFMTYAVTSYNEQVPDRFFLTNLFLSFLFILAVYYGVKTLRGVVQERQEQKPPVS